MVLVQCSECESQLSDISSLNVHYKYCHQTVRKYTCRFQDCSRSYNVWNSFWHHLVSSHNVPLHSKNTASIKVQVTDSQPSTSFCAPDAEAEGLEESELGIFSLKTFREFLKESADIFVAKISSKPGLPRCFVDTLLKDVSSFLSSDFMTMFKLWILQSLSNNPELKLSVENVFDLICNPFKHLSTEYKRFKYFESCGDFIPPQEYVIATRPERVSTKDGPRFKMSEVKGQVIPVAKVLKKFMELPDALNESLSYVKSLENQGEMLSSFLQCDVWRRKISRYQRDDIVLPLMIYYDDFEPNNVLGPHCEKLGAVYLFLPFLPPECQGKLENIFVALLFNAADRTTYGNYKTFKPLIEQLIDLETNGVLLEAFGQPLRVYFLTGLLLGDNLGLNGMCGFVESFSANHCCRTCSVHKDDLGNMFEEDPNLLRTREKYLSDVAVNDISLTGIKEQCVFDEIPSFESPTDISADCFHETDEGVSHYVMIPVLQHFHSLNDMFIETLNSRMYMVDLGVDNDNRPPSIDIDKLKRSKKIKMTGSEMLTFVRLFGVLTIDLIPENDPYYALYLLLHDVVSIVHAKILPRNAAVILSVKVKELNKLYVQLTGETLKPKHHFLIHYPSYLILIGPTGAVSTIRLEAKHKILKLITNVCVSRRNLPKTVAIKHQLNLCYRFKCKESIKPHFTVGSGQIIDLTRLATYATFRQSLPDTFANQSSVFCSKWVDYLGTKYKVNDVLVTGFTEHGCPEFSEIKLILPEDDGCTFICSMLFTLGYYSEVRGYEVERTVVEDWKCVYHKDLIDPFPLTLLSTYKGELVLILKSFL